MQIVHTRACGVGMGVYYFMYVNKRMNATVIHDDVGGPGALGLARQSF